MSQESRRRRRLPLGRITADGQGGLPRPADPPMPPPAPRSAPALSPPDAARLAEEFTRLLATIQLDAAVLEEGLMDPEERRAMAGEIVTASERLADLSRPLLRHAAESQPAAAPQGAPSDAARLTPTGLGAPLPGRPDPDLNEVVERTARTLGKVLDGNVKVTTVRCRERLPVRGEEALLRQAIFRLAVAAHESMEVGSQLQLETQRVEITDRQASWTGARPGTYASLRLVYPARADPPTKPTVLRGPDGRPCTTRFVRGLADAQRIVSAAGGHLQVAVTPGAPSWFTLLLPVPALPEDATRKALRDSWPPTPGATVLVVDGDPGERSRAVLVLRAAGYRVLEAESAEEALLILDDPGPPPKLLLTDVVLPGLPGGALAEQLGHRFPRMQVLYTASVGRRIIEASGDLSPDASFVPKPHREAELLTSVRRLLDVPTG